MVRPTYASVTATLALFISLGGGAYAAATLPANSVGAKQIKKNAVERAKIKNNAVDGSKVLDGSITGDDVKESTLEKVPAAAAADTSTHAAAAAAVDKLSYRGSASTPVSPQAFNGATAGCDAGQHIVGGGVKVDDPQNLIVVDSFPDAGGTVWTSRVWNSGSAGSTFTVYAICTTAAAVG
jgi:hypothetical protein